ncbi:hypothetical protein D3C81_2061110 [compost metagenome]
MTIGVITDYLLVDPAAIRYSILIVTLIACALACTLLLGARDSFRRTVQNALHWKSDSTHCK